MPQEGHLEDHRAQKKQSDQVGDGHEAVECIGNGPQGLYGIFEVFMDTIVICTLSGLTLLLALDAETINYGIKGTTALNAQALGTVLGGKTGALIIAIGLSLFALSTVLSWGLYGTRCWEYLLGERWRRGR